MSATALKSTGETFYHTSYAPLQNVQPGQNSYFELATGMEAILPSNLDIGNDGCLEPVLGFQPSLEITVPPCDKFRFRYKSESGSHGKLRGPAKNRLKTNFPTIKFNNCESHKDIVIKASLYTYEDDPRPHILELVGKNCTDGACIERLSDDNTAIFRSLEIESKRKEEAIAILTKKKIEFSGSRYDEEEIRKQVQEEMKLLNMNCAMLCFEAFHEGVSLCEKVFSGPIKNLKSTSSDLKIIRISSSSGSCKGGDEIILLCDKISKDDIEINFYVKDKNDDILWKEKGIFNPKVDVHHQVAIAFKTPAYRGIAEEVNAHMELYRPSDQQSSEPRAFLYIPDYFDELRYSKKRKFSPTESVERQNEDLTSGSSQFMNSSSNSSGLETNIALQESPSTSSSDDYNLDEFSLELSLDLSPEEIFQLMTSDECSIGHMNPSNLDDLDHSSIQPLPSDLFTTDVCDSDIQMCAAKPWLHDSYPYSLWEEDLGSYEEQDEIQCQEATIMPQSSISKKDRTNPKEFTVQKKGQITQTSSGGGFFGFLGSLTGLGSSSLWNVGAVGQVASHMTPSSSIIGSCTKILSRYTVPKGEMAEPAINASQSTVHKMYAQSALVRKDLPFQEEQKKYVKPFVSRPVDNMERPVVIGDKIMFTDTNLYGTSIQGKSKNTKEVNKQFIAIIAPQLAHSNIEAQCALDVNMRHLSIQDDDKKDLKPFFPQRVGKGERPVQNAYTTSVTDIKKNKSNEINKNFEHFKEGVNQVMKKREKEVFLCYISRLISVQDENGNVLIHLAVMEQSENLNLIARILKIAPQAVNEQNRFKETPLHLATQNNAWKVVLLLLGHGGNPSIRDANGNNCFHIASQSNYTKSMQFILFPNLKKGKRIPSIDSFNYDGFSPLHLAVMNNAKECIQLLLQAGADVNTNDRRSGSTPMHVAIGQQSPLSLDLLSHPDIDLLNADFSECTIVHALCKMKGIAMPKINRSADLIYWAHKTLALPTKEDEESSSTETSSNSNSDEEEIHDQRETVPTSFRSYSQSFPSQRIIGVEKNWKNSLSEECERKLCRYLDADGGWRKLGFFVGLNGKNLNGIAKLSKNSSPSKLVLKKVKDLYKNCDKQTLLNVLTEADLKDAVKILEE